jgi:hypothetical protein
MKNKIIISSLVLALVFSLGFNVTSYLARVDKQKTINNIRSEMIVAWAMEMDNAGYYLKNATTNIDVADTTHGVRSFFSVAAHIVEAGWQFQDEWELYERMHTAARDVEGNLIPYGVDAPTIVRHINPTAVEMFGILAEKIWNVTDLIWQEPALVKGTGVNPLQLLKEKGVLDDIVEGCIDIYTYSYQIHDFSPKFQ